MLKAYIKNDTTFIKQFSKNQITERDFYKNLGLTDSCIHQKKLSDLGVDEAYRFIFGRALFQGNFNITITRKGDAVNYYYIQYVNDFNSSQGSYIVQKSNKSLKKKEWDKLNDAMYMADFWGLKFRNGLNGGDADDLLVFGFRAAGPGYFAEQKYHVVYRWNEHWSRLDRPLQIAFRLGREYSF